MTTSDQVAREAREKLADRIEVAVFAQRLQGEDSITLTASFSQWKDVIAALRAQPERGAEEMKSLAISACEAEVKEIVNLGLNAGTCAGYGTITANNIINRIRRIRALPLHPDKDEGGGR